MCRFFFRNCTHILTRTQGETFENMFLVKIASKGTSLSQQRICQLKSHMKPAKIGFNFDVSYAGLEPPIVRLLVQRLTS